MILLVQIICLCYTLYVLQEYATSGAYSRQHRLCLLYTSKYTERVRLYDDDQAFMRDLFRIQEVLDWPTGQQMRPNWVKYVLRCV